MGSTDNFVIDLGKFFYTDKTKHCRIFAHAGGRAQANHCRARFGFLRNQKYEAYSKKINVVGNRWGVHGKLYPYVSFSACSAKSKQLNGRNP